MNLDWLSRAAGTGVIAAALSAQATQPRPAELSEVLSSVAKYLAEYEQRCGAVVSLETYLQQFQSGASRQSRQLKSDMLVLSVGEAGWLGFRDVFEVDGRTVRDHDERLFALFLKPSSDSLGQARKLLDESSRFNIGRVTRNVNIPMMALTYLKSDHQARSKFIDKGTEVVDRVRTREIEFREQALPRVINTSDGAAAMGRAWIDPESGRVVKTVLMLTGAVEVSITVTYAPQARLDGLWLPQSMRESYRRAGELTEGRASYSNFRKFNVDVTTIIKNP
ncbi:MAG: hypothetical protein ACM4AI_08160 [Acidobacteriota bacterium]